MTTLAVILGAAFVILVAAVVHDRVVERREDRRVYDGIDSEWADAQEWATS